VTYGLRVIGVLRLMAGSWDVPLKEHEAQLLMLMAAYLGFRDWSQILVSDGLTLDSHPLNELFLIHQTYSVAPESRCPIDFEEHDGPTPLSCCLPTA